MEEPYESVTDETPSGQPILTAAQSAVLHTDIISQCVDPGLRDGTIQDPRDCHPDWTKIQCTAGATDLNLDLDHGFAFDQQTFAEYVAHDNPANVSSIVDATDPNLTAFYRAGGRLIQWQGWAHQFIPPSGSVAYRQAVVDTMGAATVSKFYRLYMFPGVYHCGGGYGPNVFDLLTPLANWVEAGHAPTSIGPPWSAAAPGRRAPARRPARSS